jgi:hypothetical protein
MIVGLKMEQTKPFPGLLWYGGIIAIHADWPSYPDNIGWQSALLSLGRFASERELYLEDKIDQCLLFTTYDPFEKKRKKTPYFYVAVWEEDLLTLADMNLVSYVYRESSYEGRLIAYDRWLESQQKIFGRNGVIINDKGFYLPQYDVHFEKPLEMDIEEDELEYYKGYQTAYLPDKKISLTDAARKELQNLAAKMIFHPDIENIVRQLLDLERYDTAIREVSLLIEFTLKETHKVDKYGQKLIQLHREKVIELVGDWSYTRYYIMDIETVFHYIRNEFHHNLIKLSKGEAMALLHKMNSTYLKILEMREYLLSQ